MKKLEKEFTGTGEVKGFTFKQVKESGKAYLYEVNGDRYEVFLKRFQQAGEMTIGSQRIVLEEKELYPKSNEFGKTAFAFQSYDKAIGKFNLLSE